MTSRSGMVLSAVFMVGAWLGWSGLYKPLLLALGAVSCLLVVFLARRMGAYADGSPLLRMLPRLPLFWAWLTREVVKCNFQLARIILSRRPRCSPTVVTITALAGDALGQATLGNCITLTPGTVTLDDHDGRLLVHCITREHADDLLAGDMNRRIAALTAP